MGQTSVGTLHGTKIATDRPKMGKLTHYGSLVWSMWHHRNKILHHSEVLDVLLDMDTVDLSIIEEWHIGGNDLMRNNQMQWEGITLESLLAKRSRFRRDWLAFIQTARLAIQPREEDAEPMRLILREPW
jgi:hypothetical protein